MIEKRVEKGIDPKSLAAIVYTGPFVFDQTERIAIRAMTEILQTRLREMIREQLGGTYSINASASDSFRSRWPSTRLTIAWGRRSGSGWTNWSGASSKRWRRSKPTWPTPQQVSDGARGAASRDYESVTKQNGWWLSRILALRYEDREDPAGLLNLPDYYRKIDTAMIQRAARTYLKGDNRIQVTLVPEKK